MDDLHFGKWYHIPAAKTHCSYYSTSNTSEHVNCSENMLTNCN